MSKDPRSSDTEGKIMKFSKELIEKAKTAGTPEELLAMAKAEKMEITAEEAAKIFADLNKAGELADEELDSVSGGCGDPEPDAKWGAPGEYDHAEDVKFEFAIGTRVVVYPTPSKWKKGTVTARKTEHSDWGFHAAYLVHHDDSGIADDWYAQPTVGRLI